jgi:adenylate cyclase, class 2
MKEIEAKILNIDRKKLEIKLKQIGAKLVFSGIVHAIFFDFKDKRLKKEKVGLRLRTVGKNAFLTVKTRPKNLRSQNNLKIRDEIEIKIPNFDQAKKLLESLGLKVWLEMKKHRTSYNLKGTRFEFDKHMDQYSHIPEFLEIEAKDAKTVYRYAKLLDFEKSDCKPWTVADIEKHMKAGRIKLVKKK